MFRTIISYIPLLQSLAYFPLRVHLQALVKLGVLWVLTSLPVIFAVVLSPIPKGPEAISAKLLSRTAAAFSTAEQFVYAAAFLAPILFIIYEKFVASDEETILDRIRDIKLFHGYWLTAFVAVVLLFLTAASYSALKVSPSVFQTTFLYAFLVSASLWIYGFAVYCWYLTLLDSSFTGDFVVANRRGEQDAQNSLAARLRNKIRGP